MSEGKGDHDLIGLLLTIREKGQNLSLVHFYFIGNSEVFSSNAKRQHL